MQTTFWHRPCGSPPSGPQHDVARRSAVWTGCGGWTRGRALRERRAPRCNRDCNAQRREPHLHGPHVADETRRAAVGLRHPGAHCWARTGRGDWRWVCSMCQRAEERADYTVSSAPTGHADALAPGCWRGVKNRPNWHSGVPSVRGIHLHNQSPSQSVELSVRPAPRHCVGGGGAA